MKYSSQIKSMPLDLFTPDLDHLGTAFIPIEKSDLLEGLDLSLEDHKIDFTRTTTEAEMIDLASDYNDGRDSVPVHVRLKEKELELFKQQLVHVNPEGKKHRLAASIAKALNFQEIPDKMLNDYIYDCIKNLENDAIDDLIIFQIQTTETFKKKLNAILDDYRYNQFKVWLDSGRIKKQDGAGFPKHITLLNKLIGVPKGLYCEEENVNDFETRVICAISSEDNVLFWHRNQERGKGFFINGFINHYPDFIVKLKSGHILLIETKGDDRDNSDSQRKLELGRIWANMAGTQYRYYMVFDTKRLDNAITIPELINRISDLANHK